MECRMPPREERPEDTECHLGPAFVPVPGRRQLWILLGALDGALRRVVALRCAAASGAAGKRCWLLELERWPQKSSHAAPAWRQRGPPSSGQPGPQTSWTCTRGSRHQHPPWLIRAPFVCEFDQSSA